jgi:hypothetical protein
MNARVAGVVGAVAVAALVAASTALPTSRVVPKGAHSLGTAPATIQGTAQTGKLRKDDPVPACTVSGGVVWYTIKAPHRGPLVAKLVAGGELDGALVVYRIVRSQRLPVLCAQTNRHGRARVAWYGLVDGTYLVGVARRDSSAGGPYELSILAAEPLPRPPGDALPASGGVGTVNPVLDRSDAYAVSMQKGTTYKLNVTSPGGCLGLAIYRPGVYSFRTAATVREESCGGYTVFTPGIDGGGIYSVVVSDRSASPVNHWYRLSVAPAAVDDLAPGTTLTNGQFVSGTVNARTLDVVDVYRFAVPRDNELTTLDLRQKPNQAFQLLVLDETGGHIAAAKASGRQVIRQHIPAGHYYAVVEAAGGGSGAYGLQLFVRDVTETTINAAGSKFAEVPAGTTVPITVSVSSASHGGPVLVEIDRLDPLYGWQFSSVVREQLGAGGQFVMNWVPPAVGHWRVRARFVGTPFSSYSESNYARIHIAEPLE